MQSFNTCLLTISLVRLHPPQHQSLEAFNSELHACQEALLALIAQREADSAPKQPPKTKPPSQRTTKRASSGKKNRTGPKHVKIPNAVQMTYESLPDWAKRTPQKGDRCAAMVSSRELWILVTVDFQESDDAFSVLDDDNKDEFR